MTIRKKVLAILLTICMVFPFLPEKLGSPFVLEAAAADYTISTAEQFVSHMASYNASGNTFKQTADITLEGNMGFVENFRGKYDGNGYTINIRGDLAAKTKNGTAGRVMAGVYGGVFAEVAEGATVENLRVNINIDFYGRTGRDLSYKGGNDYVGAIAGKNNGTIKNCEVSGSIIFRQEMKSAFWNDKDSGVTYSDTDYDNMSMLKSKSMVGGIAGLVSPSGSIEGCYSSASITMGTGTAISFPIKWTRTNGTDKSKNCTITYVLYAGGIVGEINSGGTVESCLADGVNIYMGNGNNSVVTSGDLTFAAAGAIAGIAYSKTPKVQNNVVRGGKIYATLTSARGAAARLIGHLQGAAITNISRNYWDGATTTEGTKNGSGLFSYNGDLSTGINALTSADTTTTLQQNGNPSLSQLNSTYWVTDVVKGDAALTNDPVAQLNTVKWRTAAAPTVTASSVTSTSFSIDVTAPSDLDANNIRYRITVKQGSSTYAAPAGAEAFPVGTSGVTDGNAEAAPLSVGTFAFTSTTYTNTNGNNTVSTDKKKMTIATTLPEGITIEPGSSIELKVWMDAPLAVLYSGSLGAPDTTAKPIISPDQNGNLINGITMKAAKAGTTIYYTTDGSDPSTSSKVYDINDLTWEKIKFPGTLLTVKAVAKYGSETLSTITEMTYTVDNKPVADAPGMTINGPFVRTTYYDRKTDKVTLDHTDFKDGAKIYYTLNGTTPTPTNGAEYSSGNPIDLTGVTGSSVQIRAYLWRANYPDSQLLSETVNLKTEHGKPIFSIANNAFIPSGKTLSFLPNPSDLPEAIRPSYYMKPGDSAVYTLDAVMNNPGDYYGVLEVSYNEVNPFRYSDYANNIPSVSCEFDNNTRTYSFGTPEIRHMLDGEEVSGTRENHVPGNGFTLSGKAGADITVKAQLKSKNTDIYSDGEVETRTFKFYTAVATPNAAPTTAEDNRTLMGAGQTVSLSCTTSGAQIFYSLTGMPKVMPDGNGGYIPAKLDSATQTYVPDIGAGQATFAYDTTRGIKVSGMPGSYFVVYAGAVTNDMSPSEIGIYTYQVADLNSVAVPTATPNTSAGSVTTIESGSSVVLVSATSGAQIFYSTEGVPEVSYNGLVYTTAEGTEEYKRTTGIHVTGTPGSICTIYAVALKDGMGDSEVVTLTYRIADLPMVSPPMITPQTSEGNVTTLSLGTKISLTCATSGAKIYYATNGLSDLVGGVPTAGTKEYKATDGIAVEGDPGSFYSLSAIAVKDNMTNSNVATFTYRIADLPIAEAPVATPKSADDSPVTLQSGSVVTLQTGTSAAQIFYSLNGAPVVNKSGAAYSAGPDTFRFDKSITVHGNAGDFFVIRAVAVKDGWQQSEIATFTYQLPAAVQAVYATPGEGTVAKGTEVTLATTTHGATIFYEIASKENDLEDPVAHESQVYSKPFKIEANTYISAMAVKDGVESVIMEYKYKLATQVEAPVPSISSGSVVAKGTKVSFTTTSGASIAYTKDGSDPTDEKNTKRMYGSEVAIDAEEGKSVSISLYATKTGMTPSEVVSVSYTVSKAEDVMTANPPANSTVKPGDRITLSTSVTGSEIHYTTDGSEPTRDSAKGSTVLVDGEHGEAFVIRAIAATDSTVTAPYVFSYQVVARTPTPSASIPNGAIILKGASVVLTAPEGTVYYTTDGSEPASSGQIYTEPISLTGSTVLKIIAVADGKAISLTAEYIYTMAGQVAAPTASLPSGTIDVGSKITLSTTTEGAAIYYTTNGVDPASDNLGDCFTYEGPITISRPVSIRMFAVKQGMNASVVNAVTYTVAYPVEEEQEEQDVSTMQWNADKLFLFDQFVDSGEGPLFTDIVLRDSLTLTVVSATGEALPENVRLVVERERSPSFEDEDAVTRLLEMKLGALYDISLVGQNGEAVQPFISDSVEIGVPIPEGYGDTVVLICRINENGTVTTFPTRRSAGMLYAVVDHFSKYAVAVPPPLETKGSTPQSWYLWFSLAGIFVVGAAALTAIITKKRKKAKTSE